VLELDRLRLAVAFVAWVANPEYERNLLAVVVGPLLAGAETQARLQAADLVVPGGEGILLRWHLLWFLDFNFQFPGGELIQSGVDLDCARRRVS
jgi:hypothetical protein